ncbi:MAG TPA: FAD-dependent oxidoreductase [Thermoanaerobaculia bacterium]
MSKNVVIVGGGLAGLAASIYLARGGRTVTVFEKRRYLGGRAITQLRQGYRFNLGAHAFYRTGAGAAVCRELGIPVRGVVPKPKAIALVNGQERRFPTNVLSLLGTSLLSLSGKAQLGQALWRIRRIERNPPAPSQTVRDWIDEHLTDTRAKQVLETLIRLATYSNHADTASAALSLAQMKIALRGAIYVHEGWQRIIDAMHSTAISAGVNFVSSSRIVGVDTGGGEVRAIRLGGLEFDADRMDTLAVAYPETTPEAVDGARLPAQTVILAVDPVTASELTGQNWSTTPITAACLDVALRSLPKPKRTFALGIDDPLYFAVHSAWAQLTPKGGALIQSVKYGGTAADEPVLEGLLDRMQPGWRDLVVHRRFMPALTVSNALVRPNAPRPAAVTNVRGLYLAGDWVGDEGLLSDAALASARTAAKAVLATT